MIARFRMSSRLVRWAVVGAMFLTVRSAADEVLPVPEGFAPQWEAQPEVAESGQHSRMVINGLWNFQPGDPRNPEEPTEAWSWKWVPGSWHVRPGWNEVGVLAYGGSELWKAFDKQHREWPLGWYQREVNIPADWAGRRVFVEFHEVNTEARVWLDGQLMGGLNAAKGRVELTKGIQAGRMQTLRVQVAAVPPNQPSLFIQGEMAEQVILKPAKLNDFGLSWDVELVTEPMGLHLETPRVATSVREHAITLSGKVSEEMPEDSSLQVRILNQRGEELVTWKQENLEGDEWETEKDWVPDSYWDLHTPDLLAAEVTLLQGDKVLDVRTLSFGFREIRIDGKQILLNEIPLRLRPVPHIDMPLTEDMIWQYVRGVKHAGFNCLMIHGLNKQDLFADAADEVGILLLAELPEIKNFAFRGGWEEGKADWEVSMKKELERFHHHPSIIMWWTGFNVFAHGEDQNPDHLGQDSMLIDHPDWVKRAAVGWEALDMIRAADATRPVYSHNASALGDMQTVNNYLNLIPLQEREEWLSDWAENGTKPYLACEFGTPLNNTMMQGKAGGGWAFSDRGSANSASMMTEYAAIYFGPEAYRLEEPAYQDMIRSTHRNGFVHVNWGRPFQLLNFAPAHQKLQELFIRNSFRSWRAWGTTGGMNPWSQGHGFKYHSWRVNKDNLSMGPYVPGKRGLYRPMIGEQVWKNFRGGFTVKPAGEVLLSNNQPLLAFIGGDAEQGFTDKDHQFHLGDRLAKQVVLINDRRVPIRFEGTWTVTLGDQTLGTGDIDHTVEPGANAFLPFEVELPGEGDKRLEGEIVLTLKAGGRDLTDRFPYFQYPFAREAALLADSDLSVHLLEGDGTTRGWLESLGVNVQLWAGEGTHVIVGRGALDADPDRIQELQDWVKAGGRLLISSPSTEWLTESVGFRITPHPSRRMYITPNAPKSLRRLDANALRDWSGFTTRVEAYPTYEVDEFTFGKKPPHGWRWGNRGSVAYTMIEKPHHSGWVPWIEGEFDLAYSPFLIRSEGSGLMALSTLDLEDQIPVDPVARVLGAQLLVEWMNSPVVPQRPTAYVGERDARSTLLDLGLILDAESAESAELVVLGRGHGISEQKLSEWRDQGKNLLFLRRAELPSFTGWSWTIPADHRGSLNVPDWIETKGLSIGDLHFRAPYPMWTIAGEGTDASGLLARKEGMMACSFDPAWIKVEEQPFMRLTRWRHSRILTQLLSSLGARFAMDGQVFAQRTLPLDRVSLVGDWELTATKLLPAAKRPQDGPDDEGITELASAVISGTADPDWKTVQVPGPVEQVEAWKENEGEFVYRLTVEVPEAWAGQDLVLSLGTVDDADDTFWNGERIGGVKLGTPNSWSRIRQYTIRKDLVKPGENVIHVRTFDRFGKGGILGLPSDTHLRVKWGRPLSWYHADYREDFAYGDDPYRYYRW